MVSGPTSRLNPNESESAAVELKGKESDESGSNMLKNVRYLGQEDDSSDSDKN